jgi:ABC-type amino acid transport system permease subunit
MEVRSIQLFGFVAIVFLVTCYISSVISRRFEVKRERGY